MCLNILLAMHIYAAGVHGTLGGGAINLWHHAPISYLIIIKATGWAFNFLQN